MKIIFNPHYTSRPYCQSDNREHFNTLFCGKPQLLSILLLYAGVSPSCVSEEERFARYFDSLQQRIKPEHLFYKSFKVDPAGACQAILNWRDTIVEYGFDVKAYKGENTKLSFIRDVEPEDLPRGVADDWNLILNGLKENSLGLFLPKGTSIEVTMPRELIEPHIGFSLDQLANLGYSVTYSCVTTPQAEGGLGRLQQSLLGQADVIKKVKIEPDDQSIRLLSFDDEDSALRYVATRDNSVNTLVYSQLPKRFDNTLRMLGRPTCGSQLNACEPNIAKMFTVGNSLFEYPLNVNTLTTWLDLPINPINNKLRYALKECLISQGGVDNEEWNEAISTYLDTIDEKDRKNTQAELNIYLPRPTSNTLNIDEVKRFNQRLQKWAKSQTANPKWQSDSSTLEQLRTVSSYCNSLLIMLDKMETTDYIKLQQLCQSISRPKSYAQYPTQVGAMEMIDKSGNIHDTADCVVWAIARDERQQTYPFDLFMASELSELNRLSVERFGCEFFYDRGLADRMSDYAMKRPLLYARKIEIIEAQKIDGTLVLRHPLVLFLNDAIDGGIKSITSTPVLDQKWVVEEQTVDNRVEQPVIQLAPEAKLEMRHIRNKGKSSTHESQSSIEQLLLHPFIYVTEYCAKLREVKDPSTESLSTILGKVAHRIIEKVFAEPDNRRRGELINNEYERIFNESITECGLLLAHTENHVEYETIKSEMKRGLQRLSKVIIDNGLKVIGCEKVLNTPWAEVGRGKDPEQWPSLEARIDMLLEDENRNMVIFDFKWTGNKKRYKEKIEQNTALQLEVYRYVVQQNYPTKSVRAAYVLLPQITILTGDKFVSDDGIQYVDHAKVNVMEQIASGFRTRWQQLGNGTIERIEGYPTDTPSEYAGNCDNFPLEADNKCYADNRFKTEYNKLK